MPVYDAFISYSHAKDKPIAAALQSVIQKLGKPWYKRRALRVFRDDTSLSATPQLWPSIEQALSQSRFLVLLASPEAAASEWVSKEIAYWLKLKSVDTILIALTDGELVWDSRAGDFARRENMPLPPVLIGHFGAEPKWVDLRAYRDGANPRDARFIELAADFAAAIHGMPKEDLLSQEVRQQRRALTMAWSAAASLLVLAGAAGWQWWEAENARKLASEQMMEAVSQRNTTFRHLQVASETSQNIVQRIIEDVLKVGGMRLEAAREFLVALRTMADKMQSQSPDNLLLQRTQGMILLHLAETCGAMRDQACSREAAEQGLVIARRLEKKFQGGADGLAITHSELLRDLTGQLDMVGAVRLAAGDQAGALAAYEESLAIRRRLIATAPDTDQPRQDLIEGLSNLGSMRLKAGDREGALALYTEALAIHRKRVEADPGNDARQLYLGNTLLRLGDLHRDLGDKTAALASFEESLALRRKLAADGSNTLRRYELSVILERLGDLWLGPEDWSDALIYYAEAESILRLLVAGDSTRSDWRQYLGTILVKIGDAWQYGSELSLARAAYDESLAIRHKLAADDPESVERQHELAAALQSLAGFRMFAGRKEDRIEVLTLLALQEESVAILRQLAARETGNTQLQRELASSLSRVGDLKNAIGDNAGALAAYDEGVAIQHEIAAANPDNLDVKADLLVRLTQNVSKLGAYADPEWARDALSEALVVAGVLACKGRLKDNDPRPGIREQLAKLPPSQLAVGNDKPDVPSTPAADDSDPCATLLEAGSDQPALGSVSPLPEQAVAR